MPHVNWRGVFDSANVVSGTVPNVRWPGRTETLDAAPATANALYDWFGDVSGGNTTGSGQKYMRNRYYDPTTGKFTQRDPAGLAGGLNLYGYAGGNPVSYSDPFGLCCLLPRGVEVGGTQAFAKALFDVDQEIWHDNEGAKIARIAQVGYLVSSLPLVFAGGGGEGALETPILLKEHTLSRSRRREALAAGRLTKWQRAYETAQSRPQTCRFSIFSERGTL